MSFVIASGALEIYLILKIIDGSKLEVIKSALTILNGSGLFILFRIFIKMVDKLFNPNEMITEEHIKKYFENRLNTLDGSNGITEINEIYKLISTLTQQILKFTESILKGWIGNYHYELSVFENSITPSIISYYDSGGENEARSQKLRENDPEYYIKKKYEVVELLNHPSNKIVFLPDTQSSNVNYSFTSKNQADNIKSTLLYCFCNEGPRVLVITCDSKSKLTANSRIESLIRAIGTAMRAEYQLSKLVQHNV
jgi:hypothetical protein